MTEALFVGFGTILAISSLLVILHRNPVVSALFLVVAFCSLSGIYLVLRAEFIGMVQVIVYAGAIMVLFLFVIMYLNLQHDVETGVQNAVRRGIGWLTGAVVLAEGAYLFVRRPWALGPPPAAPPPAGGNTQALGEVLYSQYLFPFEVTSILLLVAMVGAVMIARGGMVRARTSAPVRPPEALEPGSTAALPPGSTPAPVGPAEAAAGSGGGGGAS